MIALNLSVTHQGAFMTASRVLYSCKNTRYRRILVISGDFSGIRGSLRQFFFFIRGGRRRGGVNPSSDLLRNLSTVSQTACGDLA